MSLKVVFIGILAVGVVGGGVYIALQKGQDTPPADSDEAASFEEYTPQTLQEYRGKPVIANSWAIWCPFCIKELADFAAVQKEFGDEVVILAINRAESPSAIQEFLGELGVAEGLVFLLDPSDSFYREKLQGFSMPETLFIDREGNIQFHKRGPMDEAEIRQRLQQIL